MSTTGAVTKAELAMGIGHQHDHWCEESLTDRALVAAAAAGDSAAWETLVDRHVQSVWSTAIGRGLDPSQAAQVSAITWLRCVDHLDELTTAASVHDWLVVTAGRECDLEGSRTAHTVAPWPDALTVVSASSTGRAAPGFTL